MNTKQLEYFVACAQMRSIRRAAAFCGVSPATISNTIKTLSDEMQAPLYELSPIGIEMTEEGVIVYKTAQKIFRMLAVNKRRFQLHSLMLSGKIIFSAVPGVISYVLPNMFSDLAANYPCLTLKLYSKSSTEILQDVQNGQVDIGFINLFEGFPQFDHTSELKIIPCVKYQFVLLTDKSSPLLLKRRWRLRELRKQQFVIYYHAAMDDNPIKNILMRHGIENITFTDQVDQVNCMLKYNHYISLIPYINGKLYDGLDLTSQALLFTEESISYQSAYVYLSNDDKQPLKNDLIELLSVYHLP